MPAFTPFGVPASPSDPTPRPPADLDAAAADRYRVLQHHLAQGRPVIAPRSRIQTP